MFKRTDFGILRRTDFGIFEDCYGFFMIFDAFGFVDLGLLTIWHDFGCFIFSDLGNLAFSRKLKELEGF